MECSRDLNSLTPTKASTSPETWKSDESMRCEFCLKTKLMIRSYSERVQREGSCRVDDGPSPPPPPPPHRFNKFHHFFSSGISGPIGWTRASIYFFSYACNERCFVKERKKTDDCLLVCRENKKNRMPKIKIFKKFEISMTVAERAGGK